MLLGFQTILFVYEVKLCEEIQKASRESYFIVLKYAIDKRPGMKLIRGLSKFSLQILKSDFLKSE